MIAEDVEKLVGKCDSFNKSFYDDYVEFSREYEKMVNSGLTKRRGFNLDIGVDSSNVEFNASALDLRKVQK